jgi:hypothetical protein
MIQTEIGFWLSLWFQRKYTRKSHDFKMNWRIFKIPFFLFDGGGFTQKAAAAPSKCPYGYKVIVSFIFF